MHNIVAVLNTLSCSEQIQLTQLEKYCLYSSRWVELSPGGRELEVRVWNVQMGEEMEEEVEEVEEVEEEELVEFEMCKWEKL